MTDNPIVTHDNDYWRVWCELLLLATHKELPVWHEGENIKLQPGQLITGRKVLAAACNVSEYKVQRILKVLENAQQIAQQTTPRNRLITIINWETYQTSARQNAQQVHNKRTTNAQQVHTNKNVNNVKNEKNTIGDLPEWAKKQGLTQEQVDQAKAYVTAWNKIHGTRYRGIENLAKNLQHWLTVYPPQEILQAIANVKGDDFWRDKMEPTTLVRRKNPQGEGVDYIGKMLHASRRRENVPKSAKMVF